MAGSSHGHTPAAWTGVTIAFIGFCVSGAFMVMAQPVGFWAGMVIVALGGVVGLIMRSMGLGQPKESGAISYTTTPAPVVKAEPAGVEG
ncbi:HGxxPAAW family protein [Streptomyces humi]|uniref:HGxxPAAW family protein n=1 Tax=Streptomyces humi TaxID=1428620 RepID=UPI000628822D|nr:HGxxPAAW family protein [Streptomyces humi]